MALKGLEIEETIPAWLVSSTGTIAPKGTRVPGNQSHRQVVVLFRSHSRGLGTVYPFSREVNLPAKAVQRMRHIVVLPSNGISHNRSFSTKYASP
jgi:hypothetical protein